MIGDVSESLASFHRIPDIFCFNGKIDVMNLIEDKTEISTARKLKVHQDNELQTRTHPNAAKIVLLLTIKSTYEKFVLFTFVAHG